MLTHTSPSGADTCPGEGGVPTRPHDYGSWDRVCEHVGLRGCNIPTWGYAPCGLPDAFLASKCHDVHLRVYPHYLSGTNT